MDKLRALQAFARVAELGSFTRAADQLQWPKASVTVLVQQLEQHLGAKLLHRTTRRLLLTEDGAAYLEGAQRLLLESEELDSAIAHRRTKPSGRLRVDVPAAVGRHVIAPALPDFFVRYPNIQLELGSSDRPTDLFSEGIDCVIRGGAVHDDSLVARPLGSFATITCAAPAYLKQFGVPEGPTDITQHRTVDFFSAKTGRVFAFDFTDDTGQRLEVRGQTRVAANDADTHVAAVVAGLGLAQLPLTQAVQELVQQGKLVAVLERYGAAGLPLQLLYPKSRHPIARVRAFADWTVEVYGRVFSQLAADGASRKGMADKEN
ncbi:MAG: LysR family transcriptional regulator [Candidatus Saccharibacteria bacterium]|nr:LysR family transcriptional regulator [Rhodoferax sp.]